MPNKSIKFASFGRGCQQTHAVYGDVMHKEPLYIRLDPRCSTPADALSSPYRAMLAIESHVSPDWQAKISKWLVHTGCLYMMIWGRECSSWDDSVDLANLEDFGFGEIPDDKFVMTTWNEDEPL